VETVARAFAHQAGFTFHKKVGAGAFKETFLVSDAQGQIALKVLGPNCSVVRTDREIEALRRCSHENIARLRDAADFQFNDKTYRCLVEDYLGGGTLGERLKLGLYPRYALKTLGSGLIHALEHLHGLGLVHRDIKPENVMYKAMESDQPVIVDFGLVRDLTASSITQSWFAQGPGTPLFAAAEQLNNRKELIDWRTDQFAVGVSLTFAFCGFHPHSLASDVGFECIDRVASWQGPSERFRQAIGRIGMPILEQMVSPYPVQRVRSPEKLLTTWQGY
jgi:serine/threonine protein kinase